MKSCSSNSSKLYLFLLLFTRWCHIEIRKKKKNTHNTNDVSAEECNYPIGCLVCCLKMFTVVLLKVQAETFGLDSTWLYLNEEQKSLCAVHLPKLIKILEGLAPAQIWCGSLFGSGQGWCANFSTRKLWEAARGEKTENTKTSRLPSGTSKHTLGPKWTHLLMMSEWLHFAISSRVGQGPKP